MKPWSFGSCLIALSCSFGGCAGATPPAEPTEVTLPLSPPEATPATVQGAVPKATVDVREGIELFDAKCRACHTLGEGDLVGPDLRAVHDRRSKAWLARWVKEPSALISSDPVAKELFAKYHRVPMPDPGLSDEQVTQVLRMIEHCSTESCVSARPKPASLASEADAKRGRALFAGDTPLEAGGPACARCHPLRGLAGGGSSAKELTHVFSALGDRGLDAVMRKPPFERMSEAFSKHRVTADESFVLRAFLHRVDRSAAE